MTLFGCRLCRFTRSKSSKEVVTEPQALITQVEVTTTQPDIANSITRAEQSVRLRNSVSGSPQYYSPLSSAPKPHRSSVEQWLDSQRSQEIHKVIEVMPGVADSAVTTVPAQTQSRVVEQARAFEKAKQQGESHAGISPRRASTGRLADSSPARTPVPVVTPAPVDDGVPVQRPVTNLIQNEIGERKGDGSEVASPTALSREDEMEEEIPIRAPTPNAYEASPRLLPTRTASRLADQSATARRRATRHFVQAWIRLLEMCYDDVLEWTNAECLVRAHILQLLLSQDLRCTLELMDTVEECSTPTSRGMLDIWAQHKVGCESSILNSNAMDETSFGSPEQEGTGIPMVLSLFPPEILIEVPVLTRSFNERYLEAFDMEERSELRERVTYLWEQMNESVRMKDITTRWSYFSQLMSIFGLNDKFNFEIHMHTLLTPNTTARWLEIVNDVAAATNSPDTSGPTGDLVRVQSTTRVPTVGSSPFDTQRTDETKSMANVTPQLHKTEVEDAFNTPAIPAAEPRRRRSSLRRQISKIKRSRLLRYRRSKHGPKPEISIDDEAATLPPWIEEQKKGVVIAYRMLASGMVACKVRSRLKIPFVNAMVTLDDFDSFTAWVPYCIRADKLAQYSNACYLLSYIADLPWPIRKRETLALAGCVEALEETGQMVVYVMTLPSTTKELMGVQIAPEDPKTPRIKSFIGFFVRPLSPTETALEIRAIMDPGSNSRMLRGLIPWMVKNTVVDFFTKIVNLAHKTDMEKFRLRGHPHQDFYDSMERRVNRYLEERGPLVDPSQTAQSGPNPSPRGNHASQTGHKGPLFDESDSLWYTRIPSFKIQ